MKLEIPDTNQVKKKLFQQLKLVAQASDLGQLFQAAEAFVQTLALTYNVPITIKGNSSSLPGEYSDKKEEVSELKVIPMTKDGGVTLEAFYKDAEEEFEELLSLFVSVFNLSHEKLSGNILAGSSPEYRQLIEESRDIIYQCDYKGNFIYINPVALQLTQYQADEVIGRNFLEFIRPDYRATAQEFYKAQFLNKLPNTYFEYPIVKKDQEILWLGQNVQLIEKDGKVVAFQAIARDITLYKEIEFEREKIQEELLISEKKFKELSNNAPVGIFHTNAKGELLFVNNTWCKYTGLTPEEAMKNGWLKVIHPEDLDRLYQVWNSCLENLTDFSSEFRFLHKSGKVYWLKGNARIIKGEEGVKGFIGTVTDITERKLSEEKLAAKTDKLNAIYENSYDGLLLLSIGQEYILETNQKALELFDASTYELIGKDFKSYLDSEFNHSGFFKEQKTAKEVILKSHTGRRFWASVAKKVININKVDFLLLTIRDITDRKIIEGELIQAKNSAEQSIKAREQFLSMVSHEIRTPLNAVLGMTHLLLEEDPKETQKEYLNGIKFSAENLLKIINDILDFSKIESGKITFEKTTFSLDELLSSVHQTFKYRAQEKGIGLSIDKAVNVGTFYQGDPLRLNQVLLNLIGNAVKFTDKGMVSVNIKVKSSGKDGDELEFVIKDTGIGIPEDKLDSIFESFTQASYDTTRRYGGTGLGLSITKKLIELQGGSIRVQSEIGKGSEFVFTLQFPRVSSSKDEVKSEQYSYYHFSNVRILLAEDNSMNQLVVRKFLETWGIELDVVDNGKEALEKIFKNDYDLVLMDLHMPVMDGFEAVTELRKHEKYVSLPVVALTASVFSDVQKKIKDVGMNGYLTKPFKPFELNYKIANYCREKLSSDSPPVPQEAELVTDAITSLDYLESSSSNNQAFIREMITLFINEVPVYLQSLSESIEKKEYHNIYFICHKMKSMVQLMGMKETGRDLLEMEYHAKNEINFPKLNILFKTIYPQCMTACEELRAKLKEYS
ncbi:MAG TPA: PAS domain S-box protein [Cytophagaceae bacterium]